MIALFDGVARLDTLDALGYKWESSSRPYPWECGRYEQSRMKTSRSQVKKITAWKNQVLAARGVDSLLLYKNIRISTICRT